MADTPLQTIELGDLVRQLRTELKVLRDEATDEDLVFTVDGVEIELQTVVTKEVSGKVKFWVVEAGGKATGAVTQKIKLQLTPQSALSTDGRVQLGR